MISEKRKEVFFVILFCLNSLGDWPYWLGPNRNNITIDSSCNILKWRDPGIIWSTTVGWGFSAVTISGEKAYTAGYLSGELLLFSFDITSGKTLWQFKYKEEDKGLYLGPRSTPVIYRDKLYTISKEGLLLCVDCSSGELIWSKRLTDIKGVIKPKWGFACSPLIINDVIYINAGSGGIALSAENGKILWLSSEGAGCYSTITPFQTSKNLFLLIFSYDGLHMVESSDGKQIWHYPWKTRYNIHAATPIVFQDKVFISSGYGRGTGLIDISKEKPYLLWDNANLCSHFSTPVIFKDKIYGIDGNAGSGRLVCLEFSDGKLNWEEKTGFGSVIIVNNGLIILNEHGRLIAAEIEDTKFNISWEVKLTAKGKWWTSPSYSKGIIFARASSGELVAVSEKQFNL